MPDWDVKSSVASIAANIELTFSGRSQTPGYLSFSEWFLRNYLRNNFCRLCLRDGLKQSGDFSAIESGAFAISQSLKQMDR